MKSKYRENKAINRDRNDKNLQDIKNYYNIEHLPEIHHSYNMIYE
jgi:hypothetical protein